MKPLKGILAGCFALAILIFIRQNRVVSIQRINMKIQNIPFHGKFVPNTTQYILIWTHNYTIPFKFFGMGDETFVKARCPYQNCYVTNDRMFMDITEWDAVVFHAPEYTWDYRNSHIWEHGTPSDRSPHQEYIYATIESSKNYPAHNKKWNSYFNWTMTYRLDSDIPWNYFSIEDMNGNIVGPAESINWMTNMKDVSDELKEKIKLKNKTAAWFVSNCKTNNQREDYAAELKKELEALNRTLDIYGRCGNMTCPNQKLFGNGSCLPNMDDYYYYLAFENSHSKYYISEKLLTAMQSNLVPIVFGGANYEKFAPPNSYINARLYSPKELAKIMDEHIRYPDEYVKHLKWTNHYRYLGAYENPLSNPFCKLCEALNKPEMRKFRCYNNFVSWWHQ